MNYLSNKKKNVVNFLTFEADFDIGSEAFLVLNFVVVAVVVILCLQMDN